MHFVGIPLCFLLSHVAYCCYLNLLERSFPRAIGLSYKDEGEEDDLMLLVRNGDFVQPPSGWYKAGRIFLVEEDEPTEPAVDAAQSRSAYSATISKLRDGSKSTSSTSVSRLTSPTRSGSSGTVRLKFCFVCFCIFKRLR